VFGLPVAVIVAVVAAAMSRVTFIPSIQAGSIGATIFIILLVVARLCGTSTAHILVNVVSSGRRREVAANFLYRNAAVAVIHPGDEITVPDSLAIFAVIKVARVAFIDYILAQVATGVVIVLRAVVSHLDES
jgi:hypothetical protein